MMLRLISLLLALVPALALSAQSRFLVLSQPAHPEARKIVLLDHTKVKVVTFEGKHYKGELTNIRAQSFSVGNTTVRVDAVKKFGFSQGKKDKKGKKKSGGYKVYKFPGDWQLESLKIDEA
jgi:hypothetical protein